MNGGVALCILLFLAAVVGTQTQAPANLAKASGDNQYVGSKACQDCHSDITDKFYKNPHNKSIVSQKELPERTGCEGCHGPGGQHIAAGQTMITFRLPQGAGAGHLPQVPWPNTRTRQHQAFITHRQWHRVHQLPFRSQLSGAEESTGQDPDESVLRLPH